MFNELLHWKIWYSRVIFKIDFGKRFKKAKKRHVVVQGEEVLKNRGFLCASLPVTSLFQGKRFCFWVGKKENLWCTRVESTACIAYQHYTRCKDGEKRYIGLYVNI